MTFNEYKENIEKNFNNVLCEKIKNFSIDVMYSEKFDWKWIATKLKIFSFISFSESIKEETIKEYTKECFEYSRKNYKGLLRGLQNGFVSFAVLVSENIDESAINFVKGRPKKHFAAFEMPIILDLKNRELYFYQDTPIWGMIYYKYFREYIKMNFNILSQK